MKLIVFFSMFFGISFIFAHATPYGKKLDGKIADVGGSPAICLPDNLKTAFPLGRVLMSQSSTTSSSGWKLTLNPEARPLLLKAGDCVVFDVVPDNYTESLFGRSSRPVKLEVNQVYFFRVVNADRPADEYQALFCVGRLASGQLVYLQYVRLPDGTTIIPECDAGRRKWMPGAWGKSP